MLVRLLVLASLAIVVLGAASYPDSHASTTYASTTQNRDASVLRKASRDLGSHSRAHVLRWLRSQSIVGSAVLGTDRKTVEIHFRDGMTSTIVPRSPGLVALPAGGADRFVRPMIAPKQQFGARALILEPFADCSGQCNSGGPNAADPEASVLQNAGYSVQVALDRQVDVPLMTTMSQYNVVFMYTHSGTDSGGVAVVVTGQPWSANDPTMAAYQSDGSVTSTGIDGSNGLYWAIKTPFVPQHVAPFPAHSLLYLSGCALYGTDFWNAGLAPRGAGALLTWDHEATLVDGYFTAGSFFSFMGQGQSASQALNSTRSAGYGISRPQQAVQANLSLAGDPAITLAEAASGSPSAPTPTNTPLATNTPIPFPPFPTATATNTPIPAFTATPTNTPLPEATSTSTPTATPQPPTATPTPTPPPPQLTLVPQINPGEAQDVSVTRFAPNADLQMLVTFPNGDQIGRTQTADASGAAQFAFNQPGSTITRTNKVATVRVSSQAATVRISSRETAAQTASGGGSVTAKYVIGYGKIDVAVSPRTQSVGQKVAVFVHTRSNMHVAVTVRTSALKTLRGVTGAGGWTHLTYRIPSAVKAGRLLVVRGWVTLHGKLTMAITTLRVK